MSQDGSDGYRDVLVSLQPYRAGIEIDCDWGELKPVLDRAEAMASAVADLILQTCVNYGTDGNTIDMGWYRFTREECRLLLVAAEAAVRTLGWRVVSSRITEDVDDER